MKQLKGPYPTSRGDWAENKILVFCFTLILITILTLVFSTFLLSQIDSDKHSQSTFSGLKPKLSFFAWEDIPRERKEDAASDMVDANKANEAKYQDYEIADWLGKLSAFLQGTVGVAATIASALVAVILASVAIKLARTTQLVSEGEKRREDHRYAREIKLEVNKYISAFEGLFAKLKLEIDTKRFANLYAAYFLSASSWPDQSADAGSETEWKLWATRLVLKDGSSNCYLDYYDGSDDYDGCVGSEFQQERLVSLVKELEKIDSEHGGTRDLLVGLGIASEVKRISTDIRNILDQAENFFDTALLEYTGVPHDLLFKSKNDCYIDALSTIKTSVTSLRHNIEHLSQERYFELLGRISLLVELAFTTQPLIDQVEIRKNRLMSALLIFCVRSDGEDFYRKESFFDGTFLTSLNDFTEYFCQLGAESIFDAFFPRDPSFLDISEDPSFLNNPLRTYQCLPSFARAANFAREVTMELRKHAGEIDPSNPMYWLEICEKQLYCGIRRFDHERVFDLEA